jgi:hypothetical protein
MSSLDFAESVPVQMGGSVPDGRVGPVGSNRSSRQSIKHQSKMVTVLMTITVSSLLLLAAREEDVTCNE